MPNHMSQFTCLAYIVMYTHPLQMVVYFTVQYSILYVFISSPECLEASKNEAVLQLVQLRSPRNWRSRERTKRQEEEVMEEPKRFTLQEMEKGFSLFEEAWLAFAAQDPTYNSTQRLQQPFRMQYSAPVLFMMRKKELLPGHRWIVFFFSRGQIELNSAKNQTLCQRRQV